MDSVRATGTPEALRDEPFESEIVDSELVYEGRVWDVRSDTLRYGGDEIVRQYVDHPGASAGLLDIAGESPLETAQRELVEEADLTAAQWEPLLSVFTTPGGNDEVVHIFLARGLSEVGKAHAREAEEADIRIEWVPLAEAVTGVLAGRLRNGILALGILAAAEAVRRLPAPTAGAAGG